MGIDGTLTPKFSQLFTKWSEPLTDVDIVLEYMSQRDILCNMHHMVLWYVT
jgi:hypothetical protein